MRNQTIALFAYLLPGIINRRLFILLSALAVTSFLLQGYVIELALINGQEIASALVADILRYSAVALILLLIVTNVAEDFEHRQFERLLSMPLARWQYILAQFLIILCLGLILSSIAAVCLLFTSAVEIVLYWFFAVWMELVLVGLVGLLAILSLEKIPHSVFLTLTILLLAKLSGFITLMLDYSVKYSDGDISNRTVDMIFNAILYVMPGLGAFAQNDVFFGNLDITIALSQQGYAVSIYSVFIVAACLFDFYRKEFNF